MFSGFIIAYMLRETGVGDVFGLITIAMIIVIVSIATLGPDVHGKPLDAEHSSRSLAGLAEAGARG